MYCYPLSLDQHVEDVRELDWPLNHKPEFFHIYCCCDRLALIGAYDISGLRFLLLWNPSTGESIELPTSKFLVKGSFCYGMSFDSTNGDYKILRIPMDWNESCKVPGEILALKCGSWRRIDSPTRYINSLVYGIHSLAIIHGAFHWAGMSFNSCFVVSFSISNEVYGIPLPEKIWFYNMNVGILDLGGMLCAYANDYYQLKYG